MRPDAAGQASATPAGYDLTVIRRCAIRIMSDLPVIDTSRASRPVYPPRRGGLGVMGWLCITFVATVAVLGVIGAGVLATAVAPDPQQEARAAAAYRMAAHEGYHDLAAMAAETAGVCADERGDRAAAQRWRRIAEAHRRADR